MEDPLLKGLREVYKQNQTILAELAAIKASIGTVEPTAPEPRKEASLKNKRPWENGWSKDKVQSELDIESEPMTDDSIPDDFKF